MVMYKRILVALDGGLSASRALEEAFKLAQAVDAMLMVACVVSHDVCDLDGREPVYPQWRTVAPERQESDHGGD